MWSQNLAKSHSCRDQKQCHHRNYVNLILVMCSLNCHIISFQLTLMDYCIITNKYHTSTIRDFRQCQQVRIPLTSNKLKIKWCYFQDQNNCTISIRSTMGSSFSAFPNSSHMSNSTPMPIKHWNCGHFIWALFIKHCGHFPVTSHNSAFHLCGITIITWFTRSRVIYETCPGNGCKDISVGSESIYCL